MSIDAILDGIRALNWEEQIELFARLSLRHPEFDWSHPLIERDILAAKARAAGTR